MGGKTAIALGLVAGVIVGGLVVGGVIALVPPPEPVIPATPAAPVAEESVAPAPSASASPDASATPSLSPEAEAFGIGQPAPALTLPLVGGETVDLADLRGSPVWVNFMATWCPPCQDELPLLAGFAAKYEDAGLAVLAVDVKEAENQVQPFFQDMGVYVPVALDEQGTAQAEWGAVALPVHFWVDAEGIVRDAALGGIGPDIMAAGLQTILPDVEVTAP